MQILQQKTSQLTAMNIYNMIPFVIFEMFCLFEILFSSHISCYWSWYRKSLILDLELPFFYLSYLDFILLRGLDFCLLNDLHFFLLSYLNFLLLPDLHFYLVRDLPSFLSWDLSFYRYVTNLRVYFLVTSFVMNS